MKFMTLLPNKSLIIASLLASTSALADNNLKIIDLQHRFVADLLPIIEPLVGVDGTATGMQNYLMGL